MYYQQRIQYKSYEILPNVVFMNLVLARYRFVKELLQIWLTSGQIR